ncbi:hypothetical protein PTSG_02698, partial [Salpingoeca rosetta]
MSRQAARNTIPVDAVNLKQTRGMFAVMCVDKLRVAEPLPAAKDFRGQARFTLDASGRYHICVASNFTRGAPDDVGTLGQSLLQVERPVLAGCDDGLQEVEEEEEARAKCEEHGGGDMAMQALEEKARVRERKMGEVARRLQAEAREARRRWVRLRRAKAIDKQTQEAEAEFQAARERHAAHLDWRRRLRKRRRLLRMKERNALLRERRGGVVSIDPGVRVPFTLWTASGTVSIAHDAIEELRMLLRNANDIRADADLLEVAVQEGEARGEGDVAAARRRHRQQLRVVRDR